MSVRDRLATLRVINTFDVLRRFGPDSGVKPVAISYRPRERCYPGRARVWSPFFQTDPDAHFMDHGAKSFTGNRAESMPRAIEWATDEYGITDWSPCPVVPRDLIPSGIREAALAAAREVAHVKRLKVYGWRWFRAECPPAANGSHQTREIVAAPSKAAAARAAGVDDPRRLGHVRDRKRGRHRAGHDRARPRVLAPDRRPAGGMAEGVTTRRSRPERRQANPAIPGRDRDTMAHPAKTTARSRGVTTGTPPALHQGMNTMTWKIETAGRWDNEYRTTLVDAQGYDIFTCTHTTRASAIETIERLTGATQIAIQDLTEGR